MTSCPFQIKGGDTVYPVLFLRVTHLYIVKHVGLKRKKKLACKPPFPNLHLCYWKRTACHFTLFALHEHGWDQPLPRHTGGSFTGWLQVRLLGGKLAQAEPPGWIASGVILTCFFAVKSRIFWFILLPLLFFWMSFQHWKDLALED